jgi:hypothetical protein
MNTKPRPIPQRVVKPPPVKTITKDPFGNSTTSAESIFDSDPSHEIQKEKSNESLGNLSNNERSVEIINDTNIHDTIR